MPDPPSPDDKPRILKVGDVAKGLGHTAGSVFRGMRLPRIRKSRPGMSPGIEHDQLDAMPSADERTYVSAIDYGESKVDIRDIVDVDHFLEQHRPDWCGVRWLNVDGLHDMQVLGAIARKYDLHPLALEDMLHRPQRPKVEDYDGKADQHPRLFIIVPMLTLENGHLRREQISIFVGQRTILTFQETHGDIWNPIRERINKAGSRIRKNDASFLAYALLDAIVDHCFPILEQYGNKLEDLEVSLLEDNPRESIVKDVYAIKRELLLLRRELWPLREVVHSLQRDPHPTVTDTTRLYFRDVYDHIVQIIELTETYREFSSGLAETYLTVMGNRLNAVMKVLTVFATIFIPITFLAGVYGMNMAIPENHWRYGYAYFWTVCLSLAAGLLIWFRRKKWI